MKRFRSWLSVGYATGKAADKRQSLDTAFQIHWSCMQCFALERVNRQWLSSVMVHNTKAISLYSDIDSCSFTTPARQLTCLSSLSLSLSLSLKEL